MKDDRGGESQMYLTQSNVIRGLAKQDYTMLREMCQYSNNLYNVGVYTIRQHYFDTHQFLRYEESYPICKENENYGLLQATGSVATDTLPGDEPIDICQVKKGEKGISHFITEHIAPFYERRWGGFLRDFKQNRII